MSKTINGRLKNLDKYIQSKWGEYYWNFLMKYEDKLDWDSISRNPNITMEIIEKYPNKSWDWHFISRNTFTKEKELFYQKYYKIYLSTFRLQQYFNRMYDNPKYKFCRDRLERLFSQQ